MLVACLLSLERFHELFEIFLGKIWPVLNSDIGR